MIFKAELNNKEDVLKWYEARENPCFVLCTGVKMDSKQIFSKWVQESDGREKLETALDFITNNQNNYNTYTIVSFPYEEGVESMKLKELEGETIRFQFHNSYSSSQSIGAVATIETTGKNASDYGRELLAMMQQQNAALLQRMSMLEAKLEEEEEEDEEEEIEEPVKLSGKERLLGALAGIVENPSFQDSLIGIAGMAIAKFVTPKNEENG
jgi:hypothetical protein